MTVKVRLAEAADAESICTVLRASITELLAPEHRNDAATLGAWLENKTAENALRWISADDRYAVVATEGGAVCGFGMLKADGEIGLLYVAPAARFRGVSRALLAALEEHASSWDLERVTATSSFTALPFYRARGYQPCGEPVTGFGVTRGCPVAKTLPAPQRIVVVGTSGCGKTVLARRLARSLRCPCVELDELYWGPQWTPKPDAEFRRLVARLPAHAPAPRHAGRALAREPRVAPAFVLFPRIDPALGDQHLPPPPKRARRRARQRQVSAPFMGRVAPAPGRRAVSEVPPERGCP